MIQDIPGRQSTPDAARAFAAMAGRYANAKRWHALRLSVALAIGTLGVLLTLLERSVDDYVAAAGATWVFVSRILILPIEQRAQREGAEAHELFDLEVLETPRNTALTGPSPTIEDLCDWGRKQDAAGARTWYPETPAQYPLGALICHRASLTWASRDHKFYARVIRSVAVAILVITAVIGGAMHLEVGQYLLYLGLPVMPALVDLLDTANETQAVGEQRDSLASRAEELYETAKASGMPPDSQQVRDLQDGIFVSRLSLGVPSWIYKRSRARRDDNMNKAAHTLVMGLPLALRKAGSDAVAITRPVAN